MARSQDEMWEMMVAHHQSLRDELNAAKNRVRNLIGSKHWPTDGSHKEILLRNVLKRHLPESLFIGTGFVVTPKECSSQIDILILEKTAPRLFWEDDLVIVTPDAVRGAIEVKTGFNSRNDVAKAILKLAKNKAMWQSAFLVKPELSVLGLFVYEERSNHEDVILKTVARASEKHKVAVDCVAYGDDLFVDAPHQIAYKEFPGFVARRTEGMAAAMLLSNLISHYCPYSVYANTSAWIPPLKTGSVLKHLIPSGSIETVSLESCLERPKK